MGLVEIGAIAAVASLVIFPVTVIFTSGRKAQKLEDHGIRIVGLETSRDEHAEKIGNHAVEIGKLNAWRDGYHAGAKAVSREES